MEDVTIEDEAAALRLILQLCDPAAGDDAAVLLGGSDSIVVSTDSTIAGVHAPASTPPRVLGRRAAARAISDLAAMGAAPRAMTCAVHVPSGNWSAAVEAVAGVAARGSEQRMPLVGGDLCATPGPLALVVTVLGRRGSAVRGGTVRRCGARVGDVVVVTGQLGAAAHTWRGGTQLPEPPDRLAAGRALAPHVRSMIDLSDGLARDAAAVAGASGVALDLELDMLPCAAGIDPITAVTFGDDYELLATVAPEHLDGARSALATVDSTLRLTKVGVVVDGPPALRCTQGGRAIEVPGGFIHR